jgi:hypothetical protein
MIMLALIADIAHQVHLLDISDASTPTAGTPSICHSRESSFDSDDISLAQPSIVAADRACATD